MDFSLEPEQEEFRKIVRAFAEEVVAPRAEAMDRAEELDEDVLDQMAGMGLFGLPFPERYGGMGADYLTLCLAVEELARVDSSVAITVEAAVGLGAMPIYRFGSERQRERWLPPLARGEQLAAFGLTEPGGGSDAGALRTRARLEGEEWVIDGTKAFITNAGLARSGLVILAAVTGERPDGKGEVSNIVVPAGTPGYRVGKRYSKIGWHASDTRELIFEDCRVPAENLLGERGAGLGNFLRTLEEGRVAVAALGTGLCQGCVDECVRYARERRAFGQPIAAFQAIAFKIADMELRAHTARLAWQQAAVKLMRGEPFAKEAAIAKLYASEAAVTCAREAVQVHGGYGYINEFPVARFYRDAKILEIGEGTSEVMRILIARALGVESRAL
jgi:alkylation response protein AidB-like acyl-CoA dehydrogenase